MWTLGANLLTLCSRSDWAITGTPYRSSTGPSIFCFCLDVATLILINLSQFALLTIVLAIFGLVNFEPLKKRPWLINGFSIVVFVLILILSLFQTFYPEYSNG